MKLLEYPHAMTPESVAKELNTSEEGLNNVSVEKHLLLYGTNEIKEQKHNLFILFLTQFKSPLVYILLIAALLSLFLGNIHEGLLIFILSWSILLSDFGRKSRHFPP